MSGICRYIGGHSVGWEDIAGKAIDLAEKDEKKFYRILLVSLLVIVLVGGIWWKWFRADPSAKSNCGITSIGDGNKNSNDCK
jgi:membrane protein DedA with SNARE-associated domain